MSKEIKQDAMCGGVVSKTLFDSDPYSYMMCLYLPDDKFKEYKQFKEEGFHKDAEELLEKYGISVI